ncbi:MAG: S24 family peptidase [Synechococcaceae cyanobacterium]|nr:S24 family peptidase [Synechococcaceae cyanobacterium]
MAVSLDPTVSLDSTVSVDPAVSFDPAVSVDPAGPADSSGSSGSAVPADSAGCAGSAGCADPLRRREPAGSARSLARAIASWPAGVPRPLEDLPDPLPPELLCPLASARVAAGFPSPADDHVEARIDLNLELMPRPLSTFLMRASGDALRGDGILDGDLLVVDRSVMPRPGHVVVATHEGRFILRRLQRYRGQLWLEASDGVSPAIPLGDTDDGVAAAAGAELWGVALHAIHHLSGDPGRRR